MFLLLDSVGDMDKMNCFLLTTCVIAVMFCNSGDALRCYVCEESPFLCRTNVTCSYEEDACLQIRMLHLRTYSCWKMSQCSKDIVAHEFHVDSFRHLCCQRDFCNKSPGLLAGSASVGVAAVIVLWMMSIM